MQLQPPAPRDSPDAPAIDSVSASDLLDAAGNDFASVAASLTQFADVDQDGVVSCAEAQLWLNIVDVLFPTSEERNAAFALLSAQRRGAPFDIQPLRELLVGKWHALVSAVIAVTHAGAEGEAADSLSGQEAADFLARGVRAAADMMHTSMDLFTKALIPMYTQAALAVVWPPGSTQQPDAMTLSEAMTLLNRLRQGPPPPHQP